MFLSYTMRLNSPNFKRNCCKQKQEEDYYVSVYGILDDLSLVDFGGNKGNHSEHANESKDSEGELITSLTKYAEDGDAGAQFDLGMMYVNPNSFHQDSEKAIKWLSKASEQGHAKATYWLAMEVMSKDIKRAKELFEKAAGMGSEEARDALYANSPVSDMIKDAEKKANRAIENLKTINQAAHKQYVEKIFDGEGGSAIFEKKAYATSHIPEKKLNAFIKPFATDIAKEVPLLFFDDTLFGGGKQGFLLTNNAFYIRKILSKPIRLELGRITGFRHAFRSNSNDAESNKLIVETGSSDVSGSTVILCGDDAKKHDALVAILSNILGV